MDEVERAHLLEEQGDAPLEAAEDIEAVLHPHVVHNIAGGERARVCFCRHYSSSASG
jgi:hypothetical protein